MIPARIPSGEVPDIRSIQYVNGQVFIKGAVLIYSSGQVTEGGANPTGIVGVATEGAGTKPGFQAANSPATFTGRVQECSVAIANRTTVFTGQFVNNSSTATAAAQADVGVNYGIKLYSVGGNNEWYVDKNLTAGNARVAIIDIDDQFTTVVWFKFLEANLATP